MATMLQIIQAATAELGIPRPNIVVGIQNTDTIQLLALLNGLGGDLQRKYIWEALSKEYRFSTQFLTATGTTTANSAVVTGLTATTGLDSTYQVIGTGINTDTYVQTLDTATQVTLNQVASASGTVVLNFCKTKYAFPSDFDRVQDRTQWDKSKHWEMLGPETAQQWQWLKSGYISTGPRIRWRIMGAFFQTWPPIATADQLGFEYIGKAWAASAAGVAQTSFAADTDTCIYPDRLMITGLKMRYQQAKGLGFDFVDEFNEHLSIAFGNDSGSATLNMAPSPLSTLIGWENIPDSNFGV
jgi:hypothetical protein